MVQPKKPEGTETPRWLEVIKAIGPYLVVGTIIFGIWRFQVEREQEAAARYLTIISELGDDSNSVRAGAVITMETYLKKRDKIIERYREQGIYVLATHLAVEPTPLVRATTEEVLVNIGVIDEADTVVRKLACSNRHLWKHEQQEDPNLNVDSIIAGTHKVSKNLQSVADTMIEILQRKRNNSSNHNPQTTLDMSNIYLMCGDNSVKLKGVQLKNLDLEGACLAKMNLEKCTIENCNLKRAHLDEAMLTEANLTTVVLDDADLVGARCEGTIFTNTSLFEADLRLANLQGANLEGADLRSANLEGAKLMTLLLFDVDPNKFQSDLNEGTISQDLHQEFANNRIDLSRSTTVSIEERDHKWLIRDRDKEQTYTVRKEECLNIRPEPSLVEAGSFSIHLSNTRKFQSDLDKGIVSQDLQKEFSSNGIGLSKNVTVSTKVKDKEWLINDKDNGQTYSVRKAGWLSICKETKFDFKGIKQASNWAKAFFDYDTWEKLSRQED